MNKFIFLYKFFIKNENRRSFNLGFIFPFLGVIIGCITVSLTFAIMEGMEFVIFNKLKNVSFPSKIINISKNQVTLLCYQLNV